MKIDIKERKNNIIDKIKQEVEEYEDRIIKKGNLKNQEQKK